MGLTERHWFEDEEPELTERQLEDDISIQDRVYRRGYHKGYSDGIKEQEEQIKNRDESLEKAREEIKWLREMLKEQKTVKPKKADNPEESEYCCGICGYPLWLDELYCAHCGRRIEWEGR